MGDSNVFANVICLKTRLLSYVVWIGRSKPTKNQSECSSECLFKSGSVFYRGPVTPAGNSYRKEWSGHYCCVPLCRSFSGEGAQREQLGMPRLSFHSFPDIMMDRGKTWLAKIRRDSRPNFVVNKNTKVCSLLKIITSVVMLCIQPDVC